MFSEGKSPVEVAIALDQPGDRIRAMYREFWDLTGRYKLAQIYDEARYNLSNLFKLHKIVKDLGMGEKEIIKVLELAKYDELQNLQWKVQYLRNEVNTLEMEKWKSTNQILKLNRMIDEFEGSLAKKRGEMANMDQETGWYDNTGNLYPTYLQPTTNSYSIQLSQVSYAEPLFPNFV